MRTRQTADPALALRAAARPVLLAPGVARSCPLALATTLQEECPGAAGSPPGAIVRGGRMATESAASSSMARFRPSQFSLPFPTFFVSI